MTTEAAKPHGRLHDRVALITGAATGIGRAFASVFAEEGADVVIVDVNKAESEVARGLVEAQGRRALVQVCDVSRPEAVDAMVGAALERFGRIDVLVNGAILRQGGPMETLSLEQWDTLMNIGLRGYFIVGQRVGREMIARKSGVIINIASTGGYHPYPDAGAYSPCKAAVIMLAKMWAMEWGQHGIRACSISPGYVRTPMTDHLYAQPEVLAGRSASVPIGRIADAVEIARAGAFLASDDASYVTAADLLVDGGFAHSKFLGVPGRHKHS
ncbi:MAG TPA: SDR family oxidoreductase [Candidatus Dormibacteraeota bacterium]|nr:SDR family oxidoreductase [Candidatus Dormibacteraeota bacterium]